HSFPTRRSSDLDAFMFWAMATGKIDTGGRRYVHELADIETLNRRALRGELEVSAVSLHAYAYLAERYALLAHGASIGDRYGPRLVARERPPADPRAALAGRPVAVPGEPATAVLLLRLLQRPATDPGRKRDADLSDAHGTPHQFCGQGAGLDQHAYDLAVARVVVGGNGDDVRPTLGRLLDRGTCGPKGGSELPALAGAG